MKLIVVNYPTTGERRVFVPKDEPRPTIVRPEAWVGENSSYKYAGGLAIHVGGAIGDTAGLFAANGNRDWYRDDQYGLEYVFDQKVELERVEYTY